MLENVLDFHGLNSGSAQFPTGSPGTTLLYERIGLICTATLHFTLSVSYWARKLRLLQKLKPISLVSSDC
jgi:hypothetical protein